MDCPVKVNSRFGMHGDDVTTRVREALNIFVWIIYHQMDIKGDASCFLYGCHDRRAYGYIRDKMSVHNIHVNQIHTGVFDCEDLLT